MSSPKYPITELSLGSSRVTVPHIKLRSKYREGFTYEITQEDVYRDRGQVLANLAIKFYGDPDYWTVIQDNNPPLSDNHFRTGLKLFIPKIV